MALLHYRTNFILNKRNIMETNTTVSMSRITTQKAVQMDPELMRNIVLQRSGERKPATASTSENEVAVIVKVTDVSALNSYTEIRSLVFIGETNDGSYIVTARIPAKRAEFVRSLPIVQSLKAARKLRPVLTETVNDIEAGKFLGNSVAGAGGKNTIVGIVDFGCDFKHTNFRSGNKSRILKIWDQRTFSKSPVVPYGALYTQADIENALGQNNPYAALGYGPDASSHGTHVMDIAAGNGVGSGMSGIAPEADIIFVEVDSSDIPWDGPEVVDVSFGDSVHLLEALRFIFDEAKNTPCVVNVSLGTNGGPHDGSTLVEQGIDSLVKQQPGRAVVIAAANSFADNIHASSLLAPGASIDLCWELTGSKMMEDEMDIWYNGDGRLAIELLDESGASKGEVEPGEIGLEKDQQGPYIFISNRLNDPNNHDNHIGIYLKGRSGTWTVRLKNTAQEAATFHAWIERNDNAQSCFNPAHDNSYTLGSISCGEYSIVVGSYDAHRSNKPLSWFSSSGPTRDGRQKPELSAPGHDVLAASALSGNGVVSKSGTSMAAPAVTGAIAVLLGEATNRGLSLTINDIRSMLIKSARPISANQAWDPRYGFGRLSLKQAVAALPGMVLPKGQKKKTASAKIKSVGGQKKPGSRKRRA
jgi:subtilisin family serine protease